MKTFKTKIIIMMVLLIVLLVAGLSIISYNSAIGHIEKEAQSTLEAMTKNFSGEFEGQLKEKEAIAKIMEAQIQSTFDLDRLNTGVNYIETYMAELDIFMQNAAKHYGDTWVFFNPEVVGDVYDIWYYDENNTGEAVRMPMLSQGAYIEDDPSMEWFFKPIKEMVPLWINPYSYNITEENIAMFVTYSFPIIIDGIPIAVTGTDFDFQYLFRDIIAFKPYKNGYGVVMDKNYSIIVHPDYDNGEDGPEKDVLIQPSKIESSDDGFYEVNDSMVSFAKTNNGWIFLIVAPKDVIYTAADQQTYLMILTSIVGISIAVILGIYLIRKLIYPLEYLSEVVTTIGTGNYEVILDKTLLKDKTEIGLLSRAVEEMQTLQNTYFKEAKFLNEELENLVESRTLELRKSNTMLKISLNQLKTLQKDIIEKEKKAATSQIMMELSHRVNTPLGTSITYVSFIKSEIEKNISKLSHIKRLSDIQDSIENTELQLYKIRDIMMLLSSVMEDIEKAELQDVDLYKAVKNSFEILKKNVKYSSNVNLDIQWEDGICLVTYPALIDIVIKELVKYSIIHLNHSGEATIKIVFSKEQYGVNIQYSDSQSLANLNPKSFSEPFKYASFGTGTQGLEIYLAEKIVMDGLNGQMSLVSDENQKHHIAIDIPSLGM